MFTAITLVTLAIGIGANTAIFSVIEAVLLKPLPYPHPEELIGVWHTAPGVNIALLNASPSMYFIYREQGQTFQDVGLWDSGSASVTGVAEPEQVPVLNVTDGILPMLGIQPANGRWFSRADDSPQGAETAMLTYGYWQGRFGGDPSVIGRRIMVDGRAREIIGVMPRDFRFLNLKPSLILPFWLNRSEVHLGNFSYQSIARLKPGITLNQASADVARLLPITFHSFPVPDGFSLKMFDQARMAPLLRPLKEDLVGDIGKVLWVLMGTIGMVLLIACANVANLLLVRAEGRQQELSVRAALGAGWGQIARELLLESVTLGILGGALGLGLAYGALRLLVSMGPANLPRLDEISIDPMVLLFTLAVSLVAGLLFGLIPVIKYATPHLSSGLRSSGRSTSQSRERHRARSVLVVFQVGVALVLLISSGLMIRTFQALRHVQPGFTEPEEIQTLRVSIPSAQVREPDRVVRMQEEMLNKMGAIPGVTSTGFMSTVPMDMDGWNDPVYAEDHVYGEGQLPPLRKYRFISPGLAKTMGLKMIGGRALRWADSNKK
jgi:putative ABC transport system permease protein